MATPRKPTRQAGDLLLPLPGMIVCDLCPAHRPPESTDSDARAIGWRVWRGHTLTGVWTDVVICRDCMDGGAR